MDRRTWGEGYLTITQHINFLLPLHRSLVTSLLFWGFLFLLTTLSFFPGTQSWEPAPDDRSSQEPSNSSGLREEATGGLQDRDHRRGGGTHADQPGAGAWGCQAGAWGPGGGVHGVS